MSADNLIDRLRIHIASWVARAAPRIRDEHAIAEIKIQLHQPQGDDDGTLYLDFTVEETTICDSGGGRVEGMRFEDRQ